MDVYAPLPEGHPPTQLTCLQNANNRNLMSDLRHHFILERREVSSLVLRLDGGETTEREKRDYDEAESHLFRCQ